MNNKDKKIAADKQTRAKELEGYRAFYESLSNPQREFLLQMLGFAWREGKGIETFLENEYMLNNGVYPYDTNEKKILQFANQ